MKLKTLLMIAMAFLVTEVSAGGKKKQEEEPSIYDSQSTAHSGTTAPNWAAPANSQPQPQAQPQPQPGYAQPQAQPQPGYAQPYAGNGGYTASSGSNGASGVPVSGGYPSAYPPSNQVPFTNSVASVPNTQQPPSGSTGTQPEYLPPQAPAPQPEYVQPQAPAPQAEYAQPAPGYVQPAPEYVQPAAEPQYPTGSQTPYIPSLQRRSARYEYPIYDSYNYY